MLADSTIQHLEKKVERQALSETASTVQTAYNKYRAYGIKLHMLADQFLDDAQVQKEFDIQQFECLTGQAKILKEISKCTPETATDMALMMALWSEEVGSSAEGPYHSSTDCLAAKIFEFIQTNLEVA